jgi:NADPH:quinone reductase-like Zn-dependent oxidoreductase
MKAARFHDYGPPSNLVIEEIDKPAVTAGHVLVRVHAAGVNPIDWKYRKGFMKQWSPIELPHVGGFDLAGTVEEVGPDVTNFAVGDKVFGRGNGAFAEFALAAAANVAAKPDALSYEAAASIPIGAATAWAALFDGIGLEKGQRVLINGAAGGVGLWAAQLAHWKGAHVLGTVSTKNVDFARSHGVDEVIDYTATNFEDVAGEVDAVVDTVGGDEFYARALAVIRKGGVFVTIAGMPAEEPAQERGVRIGKFQSKATTEVLTQIASLIVDGVIAPEVGRVFSLDEIAQAQELSETGHGRGRIVVTVG